MPDGIFTTDVQANTHKLNISVGKQYMKKRKTVFRDFRQLTPMPRAFMVLKF